MSDETEGGEVQGEVEPTVAEITDSRPSGLDEAMEDLFAAIAELGFATGEPEEDGSPAAGCYLSMVPADRHGRGGIVVRWLLPDAPAADRPAPLREAESVDILNEALGPLLLALGFPIEPYSAGGGWIVTGPRSAG